MPSKPEPIIITTPDGERLRMDLGVQIYRAYELEPRTDEEEEAAVKYGKVHRILYCAATYEVAIKHAQSMIDSGKLPERIEFVHADRDELRAFKRREFTLHKVAATDIGDTDCPELIK